MYYNVLLLLLLLSIYFLSALLLCGKKAWPRCVKRKTGLGESSGGNPAIIHLFDRTVEMGAENYNGFCCVAMHKNSNSISMASLLRGFFLFSRSKKKGEKKQNKKGATYV
jgi:hypothetical protein